MRQIDFIKLPLPLVARMKLERTYIKTVKNVKKIFNNGYAKDSSDFYPIVRNNRPYGDEYLLRRFSGEKKDLYAIIEHGLYFGNNSAMVGLRHEWGLGCILTSGEYRKKTIKQYYPNYYCETIGPMIAYARFDNEFAKKIKENLVPSRKTLLFFPAHSTQAIEMKYSLDITFEIINSIADENCCGNILICVGCFDVEKYKMLDLTKYFDSKKVIITSNGERYDSHFLDHQRTLIEMSDITVSNQLGTHIGYCIYLKKPHVFIYENLEKKASKDTLDEEYGLSNRSINWKNDQKREEELFARTFCNHNGIITNSQYDLCNYYWGFDKVKTAEEVRNIYSYCYSYSKKFRKKYKV